MRPVSFALLTPVLLAAPPEAPEAYRARIDAWHQAREARLKAEDGWLTLIGRDWLKPGENRAGSAAGSAVLLPDWAAPAWAGTFVRTGNTVRFRPAPGSPFLHQGKPAPEMDLRSDAHGRPDILTSGRVSMYVIERGDQVGIRIKDPQNPARTAFHGVPRYPVDPAWRVEATFTPHAAPQVREIPTVLGTTVKMTSPGLLAFTAGGRRVTLEPMVEEGDDELFLIFKDGTSTKGTYPAGRFLYAPLPKDGKVVLDFNQAINPPCAFSLFATCPVPPPQNVLAIDIPAGEKNPGH